MGSLGLGSLITEITANEDDEKEENRDSANVDAEGEVKYVREVDIADVGGKGILQNFK